MTNTNSDSSTSGCKCCRCLPSGASLGFVVLRLWLAVRALLTALEKFAGAKMVQKPLLDEFGNPDMSGAMIEVKTKVYSLANYHGMAPSLEEALRAEPLMPGWMLTAYSYALGPVLILLGLTLLLGICTRLTLFVMGLVYVSLTVGMILLGQDAGCAWLGVHTIMIALALAWADHDCWNLCKKKC
ncbi:MAG: hypothetical protein LBM92_02075 [Opitutaceae bacterium]|jgi:thiosulfate dehydrogenase [quinone] large subunit|nr:hypothetical protein [Opitutaceae bacterium]